MTTLNKTMKLSELFTMQVAKSGGVDSYNPGHVPFVTSTESNNGVVAYVEPEEDDRLFVGPAIAISGLGYATVHFGNFLPKGNGGDSLTILTSRCQTLKDEISLLNVQLAELEEFIADISSDGQVLDALIIKHEENEISLKKARLTNCEEEYKMLTGLKVCEWIAEDFISFAAAFNILHHWRFSFGRKCSIERLKDLAVPFPLPKLSNIWNRESNRLASINTVVNSSLKVTVFSETSNNSEGLKSLEEKNITPPLDAQ